MMLCQFTWPKGNPTPFSVPSRKQKTTLHSKASGCDVDSNNQVHLSKSWKGEVTDHVEAGASPLLLLLTSMVREASDFQGQLQRKSSVQSLATGVKRRQTYGIYFASSRFLISQLQYRQYRPEASSDEDSFSAFQLADYCRHSSSLVVKFCSVFLESFPRNPAQIWLV